MCLWIFSELRYYIETFRALLDEVRISPILTEIKYNNAKKKKIMRIGKFKSKQTVCYTEGHCNSSVDNVFFAVFIAGIYCGQRTRGPVICDGMGLKKWWHAAQEKTEIEQVLSIITIVIFDVIKIVRQAIANQKTSCTIKGCEKISWPKTFHWPPRPSKKLRSVP